MCVGEDYDKLMSFSKKFNPSQGIIDTTRIFQRWADVGFNKGNDIKFSDYETGAARPNTIPDVEAALAQPSVKTVILPKGDIPYGDVLRLSHDDTVLLGHEEGTKLTITRNLFDYHTAKNIRFNDKNGNLLPLGYCNYGPDVIKGKPGYSWGGGHIWAAQNLKRLGVGRLTVRYSENHQHEEHWYERGRNSVYMSDVEDCWIKDVHSRDIDIGPQIIGNRCTIEGCSVKNLTRKPNSKGKLNHYGISMEGEDNLIKNCEVKGDGHHDFHQGSNWSVATGIKFSGRCNNDIHHAHTHHTLFDNYICDDLGNFWESAYNVKGGVNIGPYCLYWNIRTPSGAFLSALAPKDYFRWDDAAGIHYEPRIISVIGHTLNVNAGGEYVENITGVLEPTSLYQALRGLLSQPAPPTNKFQIGDRVRVKTTTGYVRAVPGVNNSKLGTQPLGALGNIIGGPMDVSGDDFIWYMVNYDNQPDGWTGQGSLELV